MSRRGSTHQEIRRRLGFDEVTAAVTGAAPCPPVVIEFFDAIGIPLREVYGLSETTGVVSLAAAKDVRPCTVGPPLPQRACEVGRGRRTPGPRPAADGGLSQPAEATAEAIDAEGWLHTGDIARIEADGHLRIVDRKKELIINAAGKNMSPTNIEARLKEGSPLIGQACAIGNGRPYNVVLIVLDPAVAASYATDSELHVAPAYLAVPRSSIPFVAWPGLWPRTVSRAAAVTREAQIQYITAGQFVLCIVARLWWVTKRVTFQSGGGTCVGYLYGATGAPPRRVGPCSEESRDKRLVVLRSTSASRRCRLFRDSVQFCSSLVDLVVGVGCHFGGGHRFSPAGERLVGLVAEDIL